MPALKTGFWNCFSLSFTSSIKILNSNNQKVCPLNGMISPMEQLCKRSGFTNSVWKCHLAVLWVEAISVCNHITCVSKLSYKFIDGVAGSRVLCRVHDGFRSELRRILRITVKCIFMRSPNLENSMRRTVLHNQVIPIFSGDSVLLMPILYTIAAISVNAANV